MAESAEPINHITIPLVVNRSSTPKNIFIGENESKEKVVTRLSTQLNTQKLSHVIFAKSANNKVGYHIIKDNNNYFKVYILPKHISIPSNEQETTEAIQDFLLYLSTHLALQHKYPRYRNKHTIQTLVEIGIANQDAPHKIQNIEELTFFKLESILHKIYTFFKTHTATKRKMISYTSQTIKHQLDLAKNIKEPNKTKIHQSKFTDYIYSDIANITYTVLKLFIHRKINLLDNEEKRKKLLKQTHSIQKLLKQKFKVRGDVRITPAALISNKIHKYFKKRQTFNQLYTHLLILFGIERFYDEDKHVEIHYSDTIDTFLIQPELLYEWYLYDYLKQSLDSKKYKIKLDNCGAPDKDNNVKEITEERTKKNYHFIDPSILANKRDAKPDIIIEDILDNKLYIIDAKWKRLKTFNKKTHTYDNKSIDLNDILKLKRDCEVYQGDKQIYAILIYYEAESRLVKEYLNNAYVAPKDNLGQSTFSGYIRQIELPIYNHQSIQGFDIKEITEQAIIKPLRPLYETLSENKLGLVNDLSSLDLEKDQIQDIISNQLNNNINILYKEITKQYNITEILNDNNCEALKHFLDKYQENDIEKECIKFIHSSAASMFYFHQQERKTFDYSLPASGLWKAIEVELNASIIFLLRWESRICDDISYVKKLNKCPNDHIQTGKKWSQKVFLADSRKDYPKLDNIMLGSFPHIMNNIHPTKNFDDSKTYDIFKPFYESFYTEGKEIQVWARTITDFLFHIVEVRNPHTHKSTMNRETYNAFITYVFYNELFNFSDLIELKRNIKQYMKNNPKT